MSEPLNQPVAEFFDELSSRGHEPRLTKAKGTARFDIVDGGRTQRWLLTIDQGDVGVSRRNVGADCLVRADKAFFDRAVAGEANFFAGVLRGKVTVEGDPKLLVLLQRLFPRPSNRQRQRRPSGAARRKQ
jgi:putative sterol carrier protein